MYMFQYKGSKWLTFLLSGCLIQSICPCHPLWIVNYITGFHLTWVYTVHEAQDSWHWSWFGQSPRGVDPKIVQLNKRAGKDRWWLMGCQAVWSPQWLTNDLSGGTSILLSCWKIYLLPADELKILQYFCWLSIFSMSKPVIASLSTLPSAPQALPVSTTEPATSPLHPLQSVGRTIQHHVHPSWSLQWPESPDHKISILCPKGKHTAILYIDLHTRNISKIWFNYLMSIAHWLFYIKAVKHKHLRWFACIRSL